MQMSTRYGFAFLCMPKCASTSIETAIKELCNINFSGSPSLKHINAQEFSETILALHQKLEPNANIESFCLIREPLEWIESWYRFRSREQLKNPKHPNHKNYIGNVSYSEFISEYISSKARKPFANLGTQFDFIKLENDEIGLDHMMPMNRFDLVVDFLSEKFGEEIEIPLENVSPKVATFLDSDIEGRLRQHLAKDLVVYDFLKTHGHYNRTLHSEKLHALLHDHR